MYNRPWGRSAIIVHYPLTWNRLNPEVDLALVRDYWPISDTHLLDRLLDGLQKTGLAA